MNIQYPNSISNIEEGLEVMGPHQQLDIGYRILNIGYSLVLPPPPPPWGRAVRGLPSRKSHKSGIFRLP